MNVYIPLEDKPPTSFEGKLEPAAVFIDERTLAAAYALLRKGGFVWDRGRWRAPKEVP